MAVADAVGCQYRTAYARLHDLNDAGRVTVREISNSLLWEAVDYADRDHSAANDHQESDAAEVAGELESMGDDSPTADTARTEPAETDNGGGDTILEGPDREEYMAAIEAAREYLRAYGPASRQELVSEVMPAHPLGLDVETAFSDHEAGDRLRAVWWRQVVKPGLEARSDVASPGSDVSEWHYIGDGDNENDDGDQDSEDLATSEGIYVPAME